MTMRMLIDARHREETRVAVVKGNRIEEFDFESAEHKQLKGNIYLAKVTRVEPSLQAAFVDYGGNRHGFLAFSEIHPDYYQIPKEDREALLREEAEHAAEEAALRAAEDGEETSSGNVEEVPDVAAPEDEGEEGERATAEEAESAGDDSAAETLRRKRQALRRRYKIQDVIRRRQVLLVQVVKEERGNKGAALTTYLSLAGRYCVLMPNTTHGGGISRKISNGADRKRLKAIMAELNLPSTMGCIVRTAGLSRTKPEIKRDFDYLARLWDEIREKTLNSSAPALIYGDSDLVKRAIRDIYNRDIDEVVVEGDEGFRAARAYMKLLMPSHVRRVKDYADPVPLFQRNGVEDQLAGMYQPIVQLKSGGYLVINPTEALVSIDINSGRATREHNIEQTAYATNIEAAHEIARQLRLRDMAGLVVIDFIDMESNGHIRKVEKAMKDALKNDRARIQVGRISSFGLMEMSRQRLRTGVLEASTKPCPHCEGTGLMRTASSAGLSALRMLEDEAARGRGSRILLSAGREAAIYVLNRKRAEIAEVEERYGVAIEVLIEESLEGARMSVESLGPPPIQRPRVERAPEPPLDEEEDLLFEEEEEVEAEEFASPEAADEEEADTRDRAPHRGERAGGDDEADRGRKRRRRRGRRGGRRRGPDGEGGEAQAPQPSELADALPEDDGSEPPTEPEEAAAEVAAEPEPRKGRRRPRARRVAETEAITEAMPAAEAEPIDAGAPEDVPVAPPAKPRRARGRKTATAADSVAEPSVPEDDGAGESDPSSAAPQAANDESEGDAKPAPARRRAAAAPQPETVAVLEAREEPRTPDDSDDGDASSDGGSPRRGWWQRTFGG
ncbi:MAG TPA: Rne/Rng family ribonuclease [Allosphingosinicella sp.]|nr:Rne/Rng family ribonuclease [Allosphingosinicella sp.]